MSGLIITLSFFNSGFGRTIKFKNLLPFFYCLDRNAIRGDLLKKLLETKFDCVPKELKLICFIYEKERKLQRSQKKSKRTVE